MRSKCSAQMRLTPAALPPRGAALLPRPGRRAAAASRLGRASRCSAPTSRATRASRSRCSRAGEWVTPTLQGRPWLEKPPSTTGSPGCAFALLGETETAARLPSVAGGVVLVVGAPRSSARGSSAAPPACTRASSSAPACCPSATAAPRPWTCCWPRPSPRRWACSACGCWASPERRAARRLCRHGPGHAGQGTAGPAAARSGGRRLQRGDRGTARPARGCSRSPACCCSSLVAAPWYVLGLADQGQAFVDVFLLDHNVQRFTSTIHRHPGPFYYYLPVLLAGLFPWSGLVVPALARVRPRAPRRPVRRSCGSLVPARVLLRRGLEAAGLHPALPASARDADGPGRGGWSRPTRTPPPGRAPARVASWVLVVAGLVGLGPLVLARGRASRPGPRRCPLAAWALIVALAFSPRGSGATPRGRCGCCACGGAGFLLLVTLGAPPILAARESGRRLFLPAGGREVLAWGAWRDGLDGRLLLQRRHGPGGGEPARDAPPPRRAGPVLVLCGPGERRQLEGVPGSPRRRWPRAPAATRSCGWRAARRCP